MVTASPADTRTQIMDASAAVFCRLGYARTTIADLAAEAGVTRPTIYAYFTSKSDVFSALAHRVREDFLALQERADVSDPEKTLRSALTAYLDAYVRHLGVLTVLAHQALSDPNMARLRDEIHDRANRRHARFIERLAKRGAAEPVVAPDVIAEAITGIVMHFAEAIAEAPNRKDGYAEHLMTIHRHLIGLRWDSPDLCGRAGDRL